MRRHSAAETEQTQLRGVSCYYSTPYDLLALYRANAHRTHFTRIRCPRRKTRCLENGACHQANNRSGFAGCIRNGFSLDGY